MSEGKSKFRVESKWLKMIWNLSHWQEKKNTYIQEELRKYGVEMSLDKIKSILKQMNSWKHSTLKAYGFLHKRWDTHLSEDEKQALRRGMPTTYGGGRGRGRGAGMVADPLAEVVPAAIYFEEKKDKRTVYDVIIVINATDCGYCSYAKETGALDKAMKEIKRKWGKKYYIKEVVTTGNPLTLYKTAATRELAQYFTHKLGLIPTTFDLYFPCLFMMSHTYKVMAQFQVGIRIAQLPRIVELIHTEHLFPAPFGHLDPEMHTGKYLESYGRGVKKLYRQIGITEEMIH